MGFWNYFHLLVLILKEHRSLSAYQLGTFLSRSFFIAARWVESGVYCILGHSSEFLVASKLEATVSGSSNRPCIIFLLNFGNIAHVTVAYQLLWCEVLFFVLICNLLLDGRYLFVIIINKCALVVKLFVELTLRLAETTDIVDYISKLSLHAALFRHIDRPSILQPTQLTTTQCWLLAAQRLRRQILLEPILRRDVICRSGSE